MLGQIRRREYLTATRSGTRDEHAAVRVTDDPFGDGSEHQAGEPGQAARTDHDEPGVELLGPTHDAGIGRAEIDDGAEPVRGATGYVRDARRDRRGRLFLQLDELERLLLLPLREKDARSNQVREYVADDELGAIGKG